MWGWGVMNQVAIQEAANIRFPMDHFIGVWWSGSENDVLAAGDGANGYKSITWHAPGADFPLFDELKTHVHDKGLAAGDGTKVGDVLYNRGMYAAITIAEAIAKAQEMTGQAEITPAAMRDALEVLEINEARWAEIGLPNFSPEIAVSCADHGGPGLGAIQQWDASAKKWTLITEFTGADREVVDPLITADSEAFAAENNITPRACN